MVPEKERKPDLERNDIRKEKIGPIAFFLPVLERPFDLSL